MARWDRLAGSSGAYTLLSHVRDMLATLETLGEPAAVAGLTASRAQAALAEGSPVRGAVQKRVRVETQAGLRWG